MFTLGIDIGASKVAAALVSTQSESALDSKDGIIIRNVKITYRRKTFSEVKAAILAAAGAAAGKARISGVGLSVPCVLDKNKKVLACANIPTLEPSEIAKTLCKIYRTPVIIENDVKAAAFAELKYGIGRKSKNFVFVAFGTGVGGAIIIDGKLYKGTLGWAGEFGHIPINAECRMLKFAPKYFIDWEATSTKQFLMSKKGTTDVKKFAEAIAVGLLNITYALAPGYIIIGGGLSSLWTQSFGTNVISTMRRMRFSPKLPLPKVIRSRFGENAGVIGAALLRPN